MAQGMRAITYLLAAVLAGLAGLAGALQTVEGYMTQFEILRAGEVGSRVVSRGDIVTVHATGHVKQSGKKFWSTKDAGQQPFTYNAGIAQVITGWDQGCLGMALGEVRRLDIPSEEGYGARGFPAWGIGPGDGLLFEIEVLKIDGK